jgi:RHS repeat-associated protein
MRSQFHLVGRDRRARRNVAIPLSFSLLVLLASALNAQVGNQNPSGASGIFNGQINTGCSYDPYTGNATRSITDIAVAGGVGEYPLALVRTANSRNPSTTEVFGFAGGWNHNYNWILEDSPARTTVQPSRYTVDFPDGRVETFRAVNWDTANYYRVRPGPDTPAQGTSSGVRERFIPLSNGVCYLVLPDGGKVKFTATQHQFQQGGTTYYYYTYRARAIIDPYGLTTTLTYETTPNGRVRLLKVTEPAGRYLQFSYVTSNGPKISQITASDGRSVNYYYIYCNGCRLDHVVYYNNANWTARYTYIGANVGGGEMPPLLRTCDDPMYPGPMHKIAYTYHAATPNNPDGTAPVYGQIQSENYYDGTTIGSAVSTLTVGEYPQITYKRKETRGDGATRNFVYNGAGHVTWASDFMGHQSTMGYDSYKYLNLVIDFNRNETDYTCDPITGNVTQIQYPFTHGDTPNQTQRPTANYTYTNNYYLHTVRDEGIHTTTFTRDVNNRVTRIDYPDGGYETFTNYDAFNQARTDRMTTGGTETFTFDSSNGRKLTYRNPDNPTGNPTAQYYYDTRGRVSGIVDVLNHPTNFDYNDRGQLTVTTLPWIDGQRYTTTNAYNTNGDGTLVSFTDQLGHTTNYTYDAYRRLKSVTPPVRGAGDNGTYTTYFYYDANGTGDDYKYTDSNVTWIKPPSGKKVKNVYDDNRRKQSVTVGYGTSDAATTSYGYDNVGNVRTVTNPLNHGNVTTLYDERNRPYQISVGPSQTTTITYDTAGRKKEIQRPNGQVITNVSFDEMNRVLQQNVTQAPDPTAITKYTYYVPGEGPVGLLHTIQDPRLVATNSSEKYEYLYDGMGRKTWVRYPIDSHGVRTAEGFTYDDLSRLETFRNRRGNTQTFTYDALNRMTGFSWDDTPRTSSVSFTYDAASRLTEIDNANATISRSYYNDNLLHMETQSLSAIGGVNNRNVIYTYDADGNRASLGMPGYTFDYLYTSRNQVRFINNDATGLTQAYYEYDPRGNVTLRTLGNGTHSEYPNYDQYDRVGWVVHYLNGTSRSFNYGYDDQSNNRLWVRRLGTPQGDIGDVFSYDDADQVSGVQLNVATPQSTPPPSRSIIYDANGNRATFRPYGPTDYYYINNNSLNQYNRRNNVNASYDYNGNLTNGFDGSTYTYDAQNRLLTGAQNGLTMSFKYDGLNRQVSRTVSGVSTYSLWDGWNLVEEYTNNPLVIQARYLYGPTGLVKELQNNRYYYQDGSGSTSHLADNTGHLREWYRYDLDGTPIFYDANDNELSATNYSVRHLFTGQQWYSDIGLYDLRNRFYSPDIGRFLQPDPIGFAGDATNLYRYSGNNPVTSSDPMGLDAVPHAGGYYTYVANWRYVAGLAASGSYIVNAGGTWIQCAGAARYLGGGYMKGVYYLMPIVETWYQGASISRYTTPGTILVKNWSADGSYPNRSVDWYKEKGLPLSLVNHTAVFGYIDSQGKAHLYAQNPGAIHEEVVPPDEVSQWSEVRVRQSDGPYGTPSDRSVANGSGASSNAGIIWRVPAIIGGVFYPFGFGNRSPNLNFAEGTARTMQGAFSWSMNDAFLTGVLNWGDVGRDMYANAIGAMEPGSGEPRASAKLR